MLTWSQRIPDVPEGHTISVEILSVSAHFEMDLYFPVVKIERLLSGKKVQNLSQTQECRTILLKRPPVRLCWSGVSRMKLVVTIVEPKKSQLGIVMPVPETH